MKKVKLIVFSSIDELYDQAKKDEICNEGIEFIKSFNSLGDLINECPEGFMQWAILHDYKQFIEYFIKNQNRFKYNVTSWLHILSIAPKYAVNFNKWNVLTKHNWLGLLSRQPQFAFKCNKWGEFDNYEWVSLLIYHPHFAEKCTVWTDFRASDWEYLLTLQPQFAEKCTVWDNFKNYQFYRLFMAQPQLAIYQQNK